MGERPKADQANLNRYCVVVRIFAKQCAAFAPRGGYCLGTFLCPVGGVCVGGGG